MKNKKEGVHSIEKSVKKKKEMLHRSLKVNEVMPKSGGKSSSLLARLQTKAKGAKFRWINEQLYTHSGEESLQMIKNDESLFDIYHQGFREQVTRWPMVPVDLFIRVLKKLPKQEIGDFGCGDGKIYKECKNHIVHSFDLVSREEFITACDIANVPLEDGCLDIAIFCLALMGTNWSEFIAESNRCLKNNGQLWIAEVRSRFESQEIGGESGFIKTIEKLGFKLIRKDTNNTHFGIFFFKKVSNTSKRKAKGIPALKACIYKKR